MVPRLRRALPLWKSSSRHASPSWCFPSRTLAAIRSKNILPTASPRALTTDLRAFPEAFVIGRSTAFTYIRARLIDLKQIGRELNVRYMLEGSAQRGGDRLRFNVQLIDAVRSAITCGRNASRSPWPTSWTCKSEIVARLANTLNAQLIAAEARRVEQAPEPRLDGPLLSGNGLDQARGTTPEYMTLARGFFERALELDPLNVEALVGTASVDVMGEYHLHDRRPGDAGSPSAEAALARALALWLPNMLSLI